MVKYTSWTELEATAPANWAKYTDPDRYESGMKTVAPPGKKLKGVRKTKYGAHTTTKEAGKWLANWSAAMFE